MATEGKWSRPSSASARLTCPSITYKQRSIQGTRVGISAYGETERYSSVVGRCGAHSWLVTRRQSPIIGNQASWENVVRQSDDGGLTWSAPQVIVEATLGGPSERDGAMLSHNAAFHCVEGRLVMYGGRSREKFGVYLSQ